MPNGLLLVDKPSGPTSYDLIRWLKRTIKDSKIGHCGTLDPLASGLMILLLGQATKKQASFMGQKKVYRFGMRLGLKTDSGDITGNVVESESAPELSATQIESLQREMIGTHMQTPPMYSAIKKNGTPLYKLARKGQTVDRVARAITITMFEFLEKKDGDLYFRVECSSGTYVRTLVEDIAAKFGTKATMSALVREKIGDFSLEQALPGEELKSLDAAQVSNRLVVVA